MSVSVPRAEPITPAEPLEGTGSVPPLKEGDRLTREEFERRYDAMPHLKKAELIEGVVHVPPPVRCDQHGEPHFTLNGWLFAYRARTPGVRGADNTSVRMDLGNMPQPDCLLFIAPESGGRARVDGDGYLNGAPELIAEISASSESYDLHEKLQAYRRNGVREYLIWRVLTRQLDWFVLREGGYERLSPGEDGILRSTIFPGLWLDPAALMGDDLATLLGVLQRGLDSPEHAEFAARLRQAQANPAD
jgi:Uma2 family endonuclease